MVDAPDVAGSQPEVIAHHLILAGLESDAVPYLLQAGELAHQRSSNVEAIGHLTRAIELLQNEPESAERDQRELRLLIALGAPLTASRGYSVPEVERTYSRAGQLCRQIGGETPQFFRALYGTWRVHLMRADYRNALSFGTELLGLAENGDYPTHVAAAHRAIGSTLFYLGGDLPTTRTHLETVISAGSTAVGTQWLTELQDVVDPWITCHAYQAWTLWLQGDGAGAQRYSQQAVALAAEMGHPFTIALSFSFDAWLRQFLNDPEGVKERAEQTLVLALEQGFAFWIGWARIMKGWADAALGDPAVGIEAMEEGLKEWRAVGSELGSPYFLALTAETALQHGRRDSANRALDEAEAMALRTGEEWWQPELCRLRGELLYQVGDRDEAERLLLLAARTAHRHQAVPLVGRAEAALAGYGISESTDEPS
jgi:predicted ATPase